MSSLNFSCLNPLFPDAISSIGKDKPFPIAVGTIALFRQLKMKIRKKIFRNFIAGDELPSIFSTMRYRGKEVEKITKITVEFKLKNET